MADERDETRQQPAATSEPPPGEPTPEQSPGDDPTAVEEPPPPEAPGTPLSSPPEEPATLDPPSVEEGPPAAPGVQDAPSEDLPPIDEGPPSPTPPGGLDAIDEPGASGPSTVDEHPEYLVGGAFAAGLVLAQVLKRFGRE